MTTDELKQMISIFYDMELNNYMMQNCINELKDNMAKLGHKRNIPEPVYCIDTFEQKEAKFGEDVGGCASLCSIIGIILGCIYACIEGKGLELILMVPIIAIIFGIVGAIAGVIIGMLVHSVNIERANKKNRKKEDEVKQNAKLKYESAMINYEKLCKEEKKRLEKENEIKRRLSIDQYSLQKQLDKSTKILNTFYNECEIESSYRSLIAMGYMNELVTIEAATQLKGANGLYYLVRKELRQDNLESILNGISEKIDEIIEQNNRLHGELQKINQIGRDLCRKITEEAKATREIQENIQSSIDTSLHSIEMNTKMSSYSNAMTAYNSQRIRKQMESQAFFERFH